MKQHFSRFLGADPVRLHAAAHSHHPWPDVTAAAQAQAWEDAAAGMDRKWDAVFDVVIPEAQRHVAGRLGLRDPATIALAPNTHELVTRIVWSLPRPLRILTTDGEFHSFARQVTRLVEGGVAAVDTVPVEPYGTFSERFAAAARAGGHHLVYLSQVMFNSGYVVDDLPAIVAAIPEPTVVVVDGYHAFMALPTDLAVIEDRAFYVAGGYKYAMAGEGACFMHCPPGVIDRPLDTGWYAGFGALEDGVGDRVGYAPGGGRFLGATFDPTSWYRFNAVQRLLSDVEVDVAAIHAHVRGLQQQLLAGLAAIDAPTSPERLEPPEPQADRGHFLTFRHDRAEALFRALLERNVITDVRGDRLRIGLGIYHDDADVDRLVATLADLRGVGD